MELYQEDFEAILLAATSPSDISKYFVREWEWLFDSDKEREAAIVKAAECAIELVTTIEQGIRLYYALMSVDGVVGPEYDTRLFDKLIQLATNGVELDTIFEEYVSGTTSVHEQIRIRNQIRKIFDKADELGLEAKTHFID